MFICCLIVGISLRCLKRAMFKFSWVFSRSNFFSTNFIIDCIVSLFMPGIKISALTLINCFAFFNEYPLQIVESIAPQSLAIKICAFSFIIYSFFYFLIANILKFARFSIVLAILMFFLNIWLAWLYNRLKMKILSLKWQIFNFEHINLT